jgi:prepilin-type N-terminal cleavage/methylation domain-containing protein
VLVHLKKIIRREAGFTLTELAVAMLVVGILAAIAVPSFLGARNNAYDREAQAAVDAALTAATQHYANQGDFTNSEDADCDADASETLAADLTRLDPNYDFVDGETSSDIPRRVSVQAAETYNVTEEGLGCQAFYATALSRSGTCWVARFTVEGQFLEVDDAGDTAIVVNTGAANSSNDSITEDDALAVNGRAYGALQSVSPAADAETGDNDLATTADNCNADAQADITGPDEAAGVNPDEYYENWRTVVLTASVPS